MARNERIQRQFGYFNKALSTLEEALSIKEVSALLRDATIQRFEYTYEQLWKLLKRIGENEGHDVPSPRESFKSAYKLRLISESEEEIFMIMIKKRNLTTHTYNENTAIDIFEFVKSDGIKAFKNINENLKSYIQKLFDS